MKKIAIYIRKSVKGDENSISLEAQTEVIKHYFNDKNEFVVYKDDGFSGGNTNRPAFQRLMADAMENKFDTVACYKLDRIARNTLDFLTTFNTLKEYGIDLICVEDKYDPSTPSGRLMMTLLASLAEMERENIKQRVSDSMLNLAKQGRWTGGTPPFGYKVVTIDGGKYLELEDEKNIKYIFNEFIDGKGIIRLGNEFNCDKKKISRILHNITYLQSSKDANIYLKQVLGYEVIGQPNNCGYLPYGKYKVVNSKKIKNTDGLKVATVSKHNAVIDLDTFIKTQNRLKTFEGKKAPRISNKSFLAQMVKCGGCGSNMLIALGNKRKDGTRKLYFYCPNRCGNSFADVDKVEYTTLATLKDVDFFNKINKNKSVVNKDNSKIKKSMLKELEEKKKILDGLMDKLALVDSNLANVIIEKMNSVNIDINDLQNKIDLLEKEEISSSYNKEDFKLKEENRKHFIEDFENMDMEEKQNSIRGVINKVIWDGENIIIS
ncbi:recombinase family protein [Clostridium perfringens]|uniref:recombinase family protein n=1 Tax=Clostridium perfringens TaxID=1502 RepID=UPI0008A6899A|nr:recombinase family protein [Clostridium perfringens]AOY53659.1 DNA invertase-like protein [Clostridium perfringens]EJT5934011.1 recombinase family protein [Clostridium perfringens]ELC8347500.1 recombinase family protein [Clostridium perfringens]HBI7338993.1 recombinase family protein [Clostridium perfringens]